MLYVVHVGGCWNVFQVRRWIFYAVYIGWWNVLEVCRWMFCGTGRVLECPAYTQRDMRASLLYAKKFDQVCRVSECSKHIGWMFHVVCIGCGNVLHIHGPRAHLAIARSDIRSGT